MTQLAGQSEVRQVHPLPAGLHRAPRAMKSFILVGTPAAWVDVTFGISAQHEAFVRVCRERLLLTINDLQSQRLERRAAESGKLDHLIAELPDEEIVKLSCRSLSKAEAEREILEHLTAHPDLDAFEVAVALQLDPSMTVDICHRLVREGKLKFAEDTASD